MARERETLSGSPGNVPDSALDGYNAALATWRAEPRERAFIVAEGDSWFDYPGTDVLDVLRRDYRYRVWSVAHRGDTLESMAYNSGQYRRFAERLLEAKEDGKTPKAILLSGGGNDVSGGALSVFLDPRPDGLNAMAVDWFIGTRLRNALSTLLVGINSILAKEFKHHTVPLLVHGYAPPVPDGRGFWGGWVFLPGPWLRPSFDQKGYADRQRNIDLMSDLINRYNDMVKAVVNEQRDLGAKYVDLRDILSNDVKRYRKDWRNELHPTPDGFRRIAKRFHEVIDGIE